jgi:co-chaperonin GroES (HSP10)
MDSIRSYKRDLDSKIDIYLKKKIDEKVIKDIRVKIRKAMNIDIKKFSLSEDIVKRLFMLFDKVYFKNLIQEKLNHNDIDIEFSISNKIKNIAGYVKYHRHKVEIVFSNHIMDKIHTDKFKSIEINGIVCYDIVDVLIVLMEHEITHLVLFIYYYYKDDVRSGHNSQFKDIVWNMYRHTKITHDLLTGDIAKYEKHKDTANKELQIGMKVKCKKYAGTVINIKPRYILIKMDNRVKVCKFNEYTITDPKYEPYQAKIEKLKKKLKIGVEVQYEKYYGPITKIKDDRVYFKDENTSRIFWLLIDMLELR